MSKWIRHRYTRVPHPEPSSLLPPHTIALGHPSAPAPSIQYCASNLEGWLVSYMILYIFQCHYPKSSHLLPLPQSPKDCSIHQCLFCCLVYRVIVTIFLTVVLEKTFESPLDCKEIQPVNPKGDQSWVFIERTDAEAETPILWPPHVKCWLIGKDPGAGRYWGQEEKETTEDEMAWWHHWLDGLSLG